jgi:hypothetical protein
MTGMNIPTTTTITTKSFATSHLGLSDQIATPRKDAYGQKYEVRQGE